MTIPVIQKSIQIHPDYQPKKSLSHADLALMKLSQDAVIQVYPVIPLDTDFKPKPGQPLDRMSFGLRNGSNARTWTEVFYEKTEASIYAVHDSLSVNGDSGSPIFDSVGTNLKLVGIHTTLLEPSRLAVVALPLYRTWVDQYLK